MTKSNSTIFKSTTLLSNSRLLIVSFIVACVALLPGCAGLVAGAAGGTAAAAYDRRDAKIMLVDEKIESIATDKLYDDPQLEKKIHVNITSYNQVVLVTGEVLSRAALDRVIDIVRNLPDVQRVHNELRIADLTTFSARSEDSWITSKVKTNMLGKKDFSSGRVKVVTENKAVYLLGIVTEKEAEIATDIARHVKGVAKVVRLFEYIPEPEPSKPAPVVSSSNASK